jgi:hypothetical protein
MVGSMEMAVFLVVALFSLVEVCHSFTGACCLHHQVTHYSDEQAKPLLLLPHYMVQQPRRQPSLAISW